MKGPITFTSGQLLDLISILEEKENASYLAGEKTLSIYYMQMGTAFQKMFDRLQDLPGEQRVAELVMPTT
jgi:hypothetical protein